MRLGKKKEEEANFNVIYNVYIPNKRLVVALIKQT